MKMINSLLHFANRLASDYYGPKSQKKKTKTDFIGDDAREESLRSSQGKSDFSGSGYNGPGNVDHEKRNSNMSQRNF
jgi:hypothetical protein